MRFKFVVLFVAGLTFINAQNPIYSGAFPDLYKTIQLLSTDTRNCTFITTFLNASLVPRAQSQEQKLICVESTLNCNQYGGPPFGVSCADSPPMVRLNISAVKLPGVMSQLNPQTPINATELRICQHVKATKYCQVSIIRSDNPFKLLVRVRYAAEDHQDDDCSEFRRMLRSELDVCGKGAELRVQNGGLRVAAGWICLVWGVVVTVMN